MAIVVFTEDFAPGETADASDISSDFLKR